MAHLISTAVLLFIVSVMTSSGQACSGYSILSFAMGDFLYCTNPRERTGWTWLAKLDCHCCGGWARMPDENGHRGQCVPICWSKCAEQDPHTQCTAEDIMFFQNFTIPGTKSLGCDQRYFPHP